MERLPVPPALPAPHGHRRGSTPSLVQFATINAQIKKERTSPSLEVIDNADTDEDADDPRDSERFKSMGGDKSQSQPALNILHITSIRGRGNLSIPTPSSEPSSKRSDASENFSAKPPKPSGRAKRKDKIEAAAALKRSSSHGCVVTPPPATCADAGADEGRPPVSSDRFSNRRNTWCHASGASAVAIDNKIEQAMDLVKSHLMFAVREEVEVLKEKIAELMERINQLELENSILRAHATQDTLAQLSAPAPPSASPPSGPVS